MDFKKQKSKMKATDTHYTHVSKRPPEIRISDFVGQWTMRSGFEHIKGFVFTWFFWHQTYGSTITGLLFGQSAKTLLAL
jgi:hypothetical protein